MRILRTHVCELRIEHFDGQSRSSVKINSVKRTSEGPGAFMPLNPRPRRYGVSHGHSYSGHRMPGPEGRALPALYFRGINAPAPSKEQEPEFEQQTDCERISDASALMEPTIDSVAGGLFLLASLLETFLHGRSER